MNHLRSALGKVHTFVTLRRADGRQLETGKNETEKQIEQDFLRGGRSTVQRALYDTLGMRNEQEGRSIMAEVLSSGFSAETERMKQVPSYPTSLTSSIRGLYSQNICPPNGLHQCVNDNPKPSQDATVTIEQTWLLEDAVRKGRLNKSNALKEEVVVAPNKSRLHLPTILRRRKPEVNTTETKLKKEYKGKVVTAEGPAILSPSDNTCVKDDLRVHADVFKKVKLPDIHRSDVTQREEVKLAGAKKSGLSKEEKRARKKEKREQKERERKERKEKKQKGKKNKISNDNKKGTRGDEQNGVENSSSADAGVSNAEQDQKDGSLKKKKKSKVRNIFSSKLKVKPIEPEPTKSPKVSEDCIVSKDDECPKGVVVESQITGENECVGSEKKNSQSKSSDNSSEGTSLEANKNLKNASLAAGFSETTNIGTLDIHGKDILPVPVSSKKEKEIVAQNLEVKGPKTAPVVSLELGLRKGDSVDSSATHTSLPSEYKTIESTSFVPKPAKGSVLESGASLQRVNEVKAQVGVKTEENIIDMNRFKTQAAHLKPPTLKKNLVTTASRVRSEFVPSESRNKRFFRDTLAAAHPVGKTSGSEVIHLELPTSKKDLVTDTTHAASECVPPEGSKKVALRDSLVVTQHVEKTPGAGVPVHWNFYSSLEQEDSVKVEKLLSAETKGKRKRKNLEKKTALEAGTVVSKNIQVSSSASSPANPTNPSRPQDNGIKATPSQLTNKELPPVYNPKESPKNPPAPRKTSKRKRKEKGSSQLSNGVLPLPGPSGVPPLSIKTPKVLPAIRTNTPELLKPSFPLSVDVGSIRYIPSDEDTEEEILSAMQAKTPEIFKPSFPISGDVGSLRYISSDEEIEEEKKVLFGGCSPPRSQGSSNLSTSPSEPGFEQFYPQAPTVPKPPNRSEMLRRRAKRLMKVTFKSHLSEEATPSTISPDSLDSFSPQGCENRAMEEQADQRAWDLMIEDYECCDDDLFL